MGKLLPADFPFNAFVTIALDTTNFWNMLPERASGTDECSATIHNQANHVGHVFRSSCVGLQSNPVGNGIYLRTRIGRHSGHDWRFRVWFGFVRLTAARFCDDAKQRILVLESTVCCRWDGRLFRVSGVIYFSRTRPDSQSRIQEH